MNKKILVVSILAVFTLVAISFATVVSSNTTTTVKKKESPLYGIRTKLAIGQKLQDLTTRFVRQRVFFLPLILIRNIRSTLFPFYSCTDCSGFTCDYTSCGQCTSASGCTYYPKTCDADTYWITCQGLTCSGISILCCRT